MTPQMMARGCPNRILGRHRYHCKGLVGQPNGTLCEPENCAALHIADLLVSELREEMFKILGGKDENATGTTATAGADES